MSLKDKVSFNALKDLSTQEIQKKLNNREFGLAPEEADIFKEFAEAAPGSETRLKILSDRQETPPDVVPGSNEDNVKPPKEPAAPEEKKPVMIDPDDPTAVPEPDKPEAPEEPEEEVEESSVIPIDKYAEIVQERDAHRRANSKLGNEIKSLRDQIKEMSEKLASSQKEEPEIVALEAPIPPSPEDFEDGTIDSEYVKAQSDYVKKYKEYSEKSGETPPKWMKPVLDRLVKIEQTAGQAFQYVSTEQESKAVSAAEQAENDMWENIQNIQKKLNLPTGELTARQLNYHVLRASNPLDSDGNPRYPANEVASAQEFMKSVPKKTMDAFDKLSKVANSYYNFDENGVPHRSSDIADEYLLPAIVDKLGLKLKTVVPANPGSKPTVDQLSEHQIKVSQAESATRADEIGNAQENLGNNLTQEQRIERYNKMSQTYLRNPQACERNLQWMDEFNRLAKEMQQLTEQ